MPRHCIVLFSGGLDSMLALRLMTAQGLRATALHTTNCFHGTQDLVEKKARLAATAKALGAEDIVFPDINDDVVELTKRPRHGYGKHLNACIDCRLRTMRAGFETMRERGADFVVTGEVAGQRPMSQRRDAIQLADREIAAWGYPGLLLRPLCALAIAPSRPVAEGWVDARYLHDITGRGRDRQMALAQELAIGDYPSPGGGCLLTDPGFSQRLAALMECTPDFTPADVELLKVGRHFQIERDAKLVASRREEENYRLRDLNRPGDRYYINDDHNGAVVLLRGTPTPELDALAAGLAVYYSKEREAGRARVVSWRIENGEDVSLAALPDALVVDPDGLRERERALVGADCLRRLRRTTRQG